LVLPAKANRPQALGKIALLILSLPAHGIPPAGFWAARLARQELVRVLNLPASAALSGIVAVLARSLLGQAVCQTAFWRSHFARSCAIIIGRCGCIFRALLAGFRAALPGIFVAVGGFRSFQAPNISSSGQRLRRFFTGRGLPGFAQAFRRASPSLPLPLSIAVGLSYHKKVFD